MYRVVRSAPKSGALFHSLLDVAVCEDAVDEENDRIPVTLGELLQIAEAI